DSLKYAHLIFIVIAIIGALVTLSSLVATLRCSKASSPPNWNQIFYDHFLQLAHYLFILLVLYTATFTAIFLFTWVSSLTNGQVPRVEGQAPLQSTGSPDVFSLAESMFSIFGFVLALASAIGGLFGWWLIGRVNQALEVERRVKR